MGFAQPDRRRGEPRLRNEASRFREGVRHGAGAPPPPRPPRPPVSPASAALCAAHGVEYCRPSPDPTISSHRALTRMSAASPKTQEPSMEEILASIRRIIADDQKPSEPPAAGSKPVAVPDPEP